MSKIKKSFGICLQQCELFNHNLNNRKKLYQGDLIRILDSYGADSYGSDKTIVKLYNSEQNIFNTDVFECTKQYIDYLEEPLWPYMIGTKDNRERIRIYNERDLVLRLKCGSEITIKTYGNDSNANIIALVQMIGTLDEAGIGNFIGLKIKLAPKNGETLLSLYKNHYNDSSSLLLFRIEQLLDALKETENENKKINSKFLLPFEPIEPDQYKHSSSTINQATRVADVPQQTNYNNPFISSIISGSSNTDINNTINTPKNFVSPIISSRQISNTPPPQTSLFDYICESKTLPTDWMGLSNQRNQFESNNSYNPNHFDSNGLSQSNDFRAISRPPSIGWEAKETPSNSINTTFQGSFEHRNEVINNNYRSVQLIDVPSNDKGAIPKAEQPGAIKMKKGRYNEKKKKKHNNKAAKNQLTNSTRDCQICKSLHGRDTFKLECMHSICLRCFGKISNLRQNKKVLCPFISMNKVPCQYKLRDYELKQLHEHFEFVKMKIDNRPYTAQRINDDGEEIFECKTENCDGKWFIPKSSSVNLFKCPLCEIYNCAHCNVIHLNMTCTEYKDSCKIHVRPSTFQNLAEKLNNLVVSYIPGMGAGPERQNIPDGAYGPDGNEKLMQCKEKNCNGQWFVLQNDKNILFKCPTCDLYNCTKCNAIHRNQSCEEYQEGKQRRYLPSFMKSKNSGNQNTDRTERKRDENANTTRTPPVNHTVKRSWTCNHCTFENFSYGYICEVCHQRSA